MKREAWLDLLGQLPPGSTIANIGRGPGWIIIAQVPADTVPPAGWHEHMNLILNEKWIIWKEY